MGSRTVETRRWMQDATARLMLALLNGTVPKVTATLWSGVAAADLPTLIEHQGRRKQRAAEALQVAIEASSPERAMALADERDRCLAATEDFCDDLDAATDRCADAIDAAVHTSGGLRRTAREGRRDVEAMRRSLGSLCQAQAYRHWAPRIEEILKEEEDAAYQTLDAGTEAGLVALRHAAPVLPTATAKKAGLPSSAHLQTLVAAIEAERQLRAIARLRTAAEACVPFLGSCPRCESSHRMCAACRGEGLTPPSAAAAA